MWTAIYDGWSSIWKIARRVRVLTLLSLSHTHTHIHKHTLCKMCIKGKARHILGITLLSVIYNGDSENMFIQISRMLCDRWMHLFLIEKLYYNNHFYLTILVGFLLTFTEAHRCYSVSWFWNRFKKGEKTLKKCERIPPKSHLFFSVHGSWFPKKNVFSGKIDIFKKKHRFFGEYIYTPWCNSLEYIYKCWHGVQQPC